MEAHARLDRRSTMTPGIARMVVPGAIIMLAFWLAFAPIARA